MIADITTLSRVPFSLLLLVLPPHSRLFATFYILCGVSDVLDGFIARLLNTESEKGALLDSIADLVFMIVYAVRILPLLSLSVWIWIWIFIIAAIKIFAAVLRAGKERKPTFEHSFANKLTGVFLFILPLTVCVFDIKYSAAVVCTVATFAAIGEIRQI